MDAQNLSGMLGAIAILLGAVGMLGVIIQSIRHKKKTIFFIILIVAFVLFVVTFVITPVNYNDDKSNDEKTKETERTTELVKELVTEKKEEVATERVTEIATEQTTDVITEVVTEQIEEVTTELITEPVSELTTEALTEQAVEIEPKQSETEKITEEKVSFTLTVDKVGKYGKLYVLNEDTEFEEWEIGYYVPVGKYKVTNLDDTRAVQLSIYCGGPEYDGEWQYFVSDDNCQRAVVLKAGESGALEIKEGQFVVLTDDRGLQVKFEQQ